MANRENTNPSMGSNELGRESTEQNLTANILAGTDTQMHIAALGAKKKRDQDAEKEQPGTQDEFTEMEDSDE
jgi:hypothetical protein